MCCERNKKIYENRTSLSPNSIEKNPEMLSQGEKNELSELKKYCK